MIDLESHPLGAVLPVRVSPAARRNAVTGFHAGQLKVSVTAAPERGKANEAVKALLVKELGLRRSQVELLQGETSSQKKFLIRDLSLAELALAVERISPPPEG